MPDERRRHDFQGRERPSSQALRRCRDPVGDEVLTSPPTEASTMDDGDAYSCATATLIGTDRSGCSSPDAGAEGSKQLPASFPCLRVDR